MRAGADCLIWDEKKQKHVKVKCWDWVKAVQQSPHLVPDIEDVRRLCALHHAAFSTAQKAQVGKYLDFMPLVVGDGKEPGSRKNASSGWSKECRSARTRGAVARQTPVEGEAGWASPRWMTG